MDASAAPTRLQVLLEEFLTHLRLERGQAEHTRRTYAHQLGQFVDWATARGLSSWREVTFRLLADYLEHSRQRVAASVPGGLKDPSKRSRTPADTARSGKGKLSTSSLYLQVAALRAFVR